VSAIGAPIFSCRCVICRIFREVRVPDEIFSHNAVALKTITITP
jgi:hypothetical protein